MNKTLLVAQREYVEHLRTKTFWIGVPSVFQTAPPQP